MVLATLWYYDVSKFFGRLDKLVMHFFDQAITLYYIIYIAATLMHITMDDTDQPVIRLCIYKHFNIAQVAHLYICEKEYALYDHYMPRLDRYGGSLAGRGDIVIGRLSYGLARFDI